MFACMDDNKEVEELTAKIPEEELEKIADDIHSLLESVLELFSEITEEILTKVDFILYYMCQILEDNKEFKQVLEDNEFLSSMLPIDLIYMGYLQYPKPRKEQKPLCPKLL